MRVDHAPRFHIELRADASSEFRPVAFKAARLAAIKSSLLQKAHPTYLTK